MNNKETDLAAKVFASIPIEIILLFISYILGMFIHGIRYLGFSHYVVMYNKNKNKYNENNKKYKTTLMMKIIKYLFRDDTTIDVLIKTKKQTDVPQYMWIKESKTYTEAAENVWPKAIIVSKSVDNSVYKFLYYSEYFQCFSTTFFLTFIIAVICDVIYLNQTLSNLKVNIVFLAINIGLHILSRNIAIVFAKRFFLDIDSGLKYLEYKKNPEGMNGA
jgi:hypothetical protein